MASLVSILCMFGVGITLTLLGALKLDLAKRLNIGNAKIGVMFTALMFTSAVAVIVVGVLTDIIGFRPVAICGFTGASIAVIMLITAKSYGQALVSCMLLGAAAMCMNLGNTVLLEVLFDGANPPAASNLGNVFFGLGAFITPLLVSVLVKRIGYILTGICIAAIIFIPALIAVFAEFPAVTGSFSVTRAIGLLHNPAIIITAIALFFYVGLETSLGGWISTYAFEQGYSGNGSNLLLSGFWISMMFARLTAAILIVPEIGAWVVFMLSILSIAAMFSMITATSRTSAALSALIVGISFGPMFPTIIGVTIAKTDQSLYGSAFGIVAAIAMLGGSILPAAIGYRSQGKGMKQSMRIGLAAAVVFMCLTFILVRI